MKKKALITGVTGQDGAYLVELLLSKNYEVHGLKRRSSLSNTGRIDHLINNNSIYKKKFFLHEGDMTDTLSILRIVDNVNPDEIYNLAAQSHVKVSFDAPEYTANADALGALRILEAVRILKHKKIKIYQASTSEMYGGNTEIPQSENTAFYPRSPYGVAKLYAYWITVNYREAYDLFACNGILFNHESPIRGSNFVTKKIVSGLIELKKGIRDVLYLGNLYALRDWGHAKDYVEAMWLMLQQNDPNDYVIATGIQLSVKDFLIKVSKKIDFPITWEGNGLDEIGKNSNKTVIKIDKNLFRPSEVVSLMGDSSKARKKLNWKPKYDLDQLVEEMISFELNQ